MMLKSTHAALDLSASKGRFKAAKRLYAAFTVYMAIKPVTVPKLLHKGRFVSSFLLKFHARNHGLQHCNKPAKESQHKAAADTSSKGAQQAGISKSGSWEEAEIPEVCVEETLEIHGPGKCRQGCWMGCCFRNADNAALACVESRAHARVMSRDATLPLGFC